MIRGTQLAIGDTGRPEDRVIRIVNLHYDANSEHVRNFFGDSFSVIDLVRGVNLKTNKNTVGYVLLGTEQERIDAQALSGRQILNRTVKILPAQSGFRVSPAGNKLLCAVESEDDGASDKTEHVPAISDIEAFPHLRVATTSLLASRTTVFTRKRSQHRGLQNRILFMNNVGQGPEVNQASFRLFFGACRIVDVKRLIDPKTKIPNPTAFVMFASVRERDDSLHHLRNTLMQGRKVTLEVPKIIQNVDELGFLPSAHESMVTFSPPRVATVAATVPRSTSTINASLPDSSQQTATYMPIGLNQPSCTDNDTEFQSLLGQHATGCGIPQQMSSKTHVRIQQEFGDVCETGDVGYLNSAEFKWGLSRDELFNRYMRQQRTLLPMPSGIEGPGQIINGPPMAPPVGRFSPFACPFGLARQEPPPDVDTSFHPREYSWGLSGNQDSECHVISEESWYGGFPASR
ncbi:hypothetical protein C7974DRAFT_413045 [Boeremia exigua]|uniref:uncharacterized protein n=1 Tax=Boeremia exigua TaxID=749465 RepID=UPI001E8CDA80|nr:uncharacterized protein C7974DRAFT_413045 [Boeremia exigua]KAH6629230.1 hypothetical protein C7974DRAFT_413045 [Boeremia exigua]